MLMTVHISLLMLVLISKVRHVLIDLLICQQLRYSNSQQEYADNYDNADKDQQQLVCACMYIASK